MLTLLDSADAQQNKVVDLAHLVDENIKRSKRGRSDYGHRHLKTPPDAAQNPLAALRYHLAQASQGEVGEIVGTHACTLSKWEKTGYGLSKACRKAVADLYGLPEEAIEDIEWHLRRRTDAGQAPRESPSPTPRRVRAVKLTQEELKEAADRLRVEEEKRVDQLRKTRECLLTYKGKVNSIQFRLTGLMEAAQRVEDVLEEIVNEIDLELMPTSRAAAA